MEFGCGARRGLGERREGWDLATLYFEDYAVGQRSRSGPYVVEEAEILEFGRRFDPQPFHCDPVAARDSVFGGLVASGCHLFCIRSSLVNQQRDVPALVAGLGLEKMELPNPVRPGDALSLTVECIECRESQSRPAAGILRLRNRIENQDGLLVMEMVAVLMVERQSPPPSA